MTRLPVPFYQDEQTTIYHGDCREILPLLEPGTVDLVLADPPYGINGGRGHVNRIRGKGNYDSQQWEDTPEYVHDVCVPIIREAIARFTRVIVTPGCTCLRLYPQAADIGCFWAPAARGFGSWGFSTFNPILYYGKDPRAGKGQTGNGASIITEHRDPANSHPCPKPLKSWMWLLTKGALEGETVLDPFMGSGTTLVAAKATGRKAIGVEIEEKYCEIAVRRLAQRVLL